MSRERNLGGSLRRSGAHRLGRIGTSVALLLAVAAPAAADSWYRDDWGGRAAWLTEPSRWDVDDGRGKVLYERRDRVRVSFTTWVGRERVRYATLYVNGERRFEVDDRRAQRGGYFEAYEDKRSRDELADVACVRDAYVRIHFAGRRSVDLPIPHHAIRGRRLHGCSGDEWLHARRGRHHGARHEGGFWRAGPQPGWPQLQRHGPHRHGAHCPPGLSPRRCAKLRAELEHRHHRGFDQRDCAHCYERHAGQRGPRGHDRRHARGERWR